MVSVEAVANTRANDMASSATPASVGHRPVVTKDTKIEVSGELTTGSTLQIWMFLLRMRMEIPYRWIK